MKNALLLLFATLAFLTLPKVASSAAPAAPFALRDGDRVVFFGDSITERKLYADFVESFVRTRFPRLKVRFFNAGWAGDTIYGQTEGGTLDERLQRDVIAHHPTMIVLLFGMNDGYYYKYDEKIGKLFATGVGQAITKLRAALPKARFTLLTTPPYDDVTRTSQDDWEKAIDGGYNSVLSRYGSLLKPLAARENISFADLNSALNVTLQNAQKLDATNAAKLIPDRIHPASAGSLVMAMELLHAWNAPSLVSLVELDAVNRRVVRAQNTQVQQLRMARVLAWTQTDNALPFPLDFADPTIALVLRAAPLIESLNRQTLQATGLTAPRYQLKIDGEVIGAFTSKQLRDGINLALHQTPMMRQAAKVHSLTQARSNLQMVTWRQVQFPFAKSLAPETRAAMQALETLEVALINQQRAAAQPVSHRYELAPLP